MVASHIRAVVLLLLVLGGCAIARTGEDRFSYTPSVSVKEEDLNDCDVRARGAARAALADASDEAESFSAWTGLVGALMALEYASAVEQGAYDEAFEACLRDKGYEVGD